jgi:tRNA-specific 2-thiouridylase
MSGGVDSSVAAALLVDQGYDVVGMMLRLWSEPAATGSGLANRCCTPDQMADARRIAEQLGIPFYVLDAQALFRESIVQLYIDEHLAGRTPNPCIACNRQIRFTYLLQQALALDADYLATGHYARVRSTAEGFTLLQGVDPTKDQSYVLHVLGQEELAHTLFPLGEFHKTQVRDMAQDFGLPVAAKHDSQDLCFVSDGDHRRFLRDYSTQAIEAGPILNEAGQELGRHEGLPYYTIGQRKGLGISSADPLYVLRKDPLRNALVVGSRAALERRHLHVKDINWVAGHPPAAERPLQVKIRYKATAVPCTISMPTPQEAYITLARPAAGITPGQGAVFFDGETCLGGGLITNQAVDVGAAPTFETSSSSPQER